MCAGVGSVQEQGSANVLKGGTCVQNRAGKKKRQSVCRGTDVQRKGRQGVCRETGVQTGVEGGGWAGGGFYLSLS